MPQSKDKVLATVSLKHAGEWDRRRVAEVAAWLRETARLLVKSQHKLSPGFRARFIE